MPQFAPVAPPQVIRGLLEYGEAFVGRYHLLLAHDVCDRPEEYKGLLPEGSMIIMDNSVIELGQPVNRHVMHKAVTTVDAQIIVLPDVIRDSNRTLEMSLKYAEDMGDVFRQGLTWGHVQYMAVPQGNSLEELQESTRQLSEISGVGCWGVGRHIVELLGSRETFTRWLWANKTGAYHNNRYGRFIHLLGFSEDMEDDVMCSQLPGVMGIDSAVPVRLGQHRQLITPTQKQHVPRGDWWANATDHIYPETLANLALVRNWLNPLPEIRKKGNQSI